MVSGFIEILGSNYAGLRSNWRQLKNLKAGDFLVAYLSRKRNPNTNGFFAVGKVIAPRKKANRIGLVEEYVARKQAHVFTKGIIHYSDAPSLYEDLNDKWRPKDDSISRYAQRIDVESWNFVCEAGVPWLTEIQVGPSQQQRAMFQIKKSWFNKIIKSLKSSSPDMGRATSGRTKEKEEESATVASENEYSKGQGFQLDPKLRKAIEDHAMNEATNYFKSLGYQISDVSARSPYDLECVKGKSKLYVEVKGTQSTGESVFLTAGEVMFAVNNASNMALFIVHSIAVDSSGNVSGGVQDIHIPWIVNEEDLGALSYKYQVRQR